MDTLAADSSLPKRIRTALRLEALTLGWMIVEAGVSISAGIAARSLLLVAFGADSIVELLSACVLYWRLRREATAAAGDEEAITCGRLSWILLAGLVANALLHWWLLDSAAALLLIPFIIKEGREAVKGECCCHS